MKNPKLKLKYSEGLGDIIACFLHSKWFGWLTRLITGKNEPCKTCSERIYAFNVLVPISLWKIFFKTEKEFLKNLQNDFNIYNNNKNNNVNVDKKIKNEQTIESEPKIIEKPKIENNYGDYALLSSSDEILGEYLIRIQTFKRK